METYSWNQVRQLADDLAKLIIQAGCQPNIIVAVARGGFIPARLLSNSIGVKKLTSIGITYTDRDRTHREVYAAPQLSSGHNRILLVEDLLESGQSLLAAKDLLIRHGATVWTAAFYYRSDSVVTPNFSLGIMDMPLQFPWE